MLPRAGVGEVLPKSLLASLERDDRAAFGGRSGGERSIERGRSAKTVASRLGAGYPARARMAQTEILDERNKISHFIE